MKPLRKLVASLVFLAIAVVVVMFAVSNRDEVMVSLWPLPFSIGMRLSVAVLGALAVGIILGGAIAWTSGASRRLRRGSNAPPATAPRPASPTGDRPQPVGSNRLPVTVDRD
jgi:uncharacterized integral membrane protein